MLSFVGEYLKDFNGTQAAIRAGYRSSNATAQASRLLTKANIQAAIAKLQAIAAAKQDITDEMLTRQLARIAFFDIGKVFDASGALLPIGEIEDDTRRALASVESTDVVSKGVLTGVARKIKAADMLKALELLMRNRGMLNDKLRLAGDADSPLAMLIQSVQGSAIKPKPHQAASS